MATSNMIIRRTAKFDASGAAALGFTQAVNAQGVPLGCEGDARQGTWAGATAEAGYVVVDNGKLIARDLPNLTTANNVYRKHRSVAGYKPMATRGNKGAIRYRANRDYTRTVNAQ